jgi:hypothetical protein
LISNTGNWNTVEKLCRHPRLALAPTPSNHADAGDQYHRGIGISHGGRTWTLMSFVVRRVVGTVLLQAQRQSTLERLYIAAGRVPVNVDRLDLGAKKMIGTGSAEFGQPGRVVAGGNAPSTALSHTNGSSAHEAAQMVDESGACFCRLGGRRPSLLDTGLPPVARGRPITSHTAESGLACKFCSGHLYPHWLYS